jgi:hypothetical protein
LNWDIFPFPIKIVAIPQPGNNITNGHLLETSKSLMVDTPKKERTLNELQRSKISKKPWFVPKKPGHSSPEK